jgi:topoisomerase-4 subunit A
MRTLTMEKDFAEVPIKGRQSQGNILTKNDIHKIALKAKGGSTLGGREVWFDADVCKLNYDGRGELLGEFNSGDRVLVILKNGKFYTTSFETTAYIDATYQRLEKYDPHKTWTAVFFDADQGFAYLKRFRFEDKQDPQSFIGDNDKSALLYLTDTDGAHLQIAFAGHDAFRQPLDIIAADFIAEKSFKARGKRVSNYAVGEISELEPVVVEKPTTDEPDASDDEASDEPAHDASGQYEMNFPTED